VVAAATTISAGWWGARRSRRVPDRRALAAAVAGVALVGGCFAVAIAARVDAARHHPVTEHFGTITSVTVMPAETPRVFDGARTMIRGTLLAFDGAESSGDVVVFASGADYSRLTAGQPAAFHAQISRPKRRDLTVAV
ncbi:competence protein, partial [Mycobacterium sp. ITM-2017-0098]